MLGWWHFSYDSQKFSIYWGSWYFGVWVANLFPNLSVFSFCYDFCHAKFLKCMQSEPSFLKMVLGFCNIHELVWNYYFCRQKWLPTSTFVGFKWTERPSLLWEYKEILVCSHKLMVSFFFQVWMFDPSAGLQLNFFPDGHPFVQCYL